MRSTSDVVVFGSPSSVGHVTALMPLARRMLERGLTVVWAISGGADEPASAWRVPLTEMGVHFVDIDETAPKIAIIAASEAPNILDALRRVAARASGIESCAAAAIRSAVAGRPIVAAVYEYFALWFYVAMRRLGVSRIHAVVSAFPSVLDAFPSDIWVDDPTYRCSLERLRRSGFGCFDETPRAGLLPADDALEVLCFSSRRLCPDAPRYVRLLGVPREVLPRVDNMLSMPQEHEVLVRRLRAGRASGARIVLLSMGTIVTRLLMKLGPSHMAFLKRLYSTLAAASLDAGAIVVASTTRASPAVLGIDETTLGIAARERVIAMPFVPQALLFAHDLVDAMLTHGGPNTFHEAVMARVPLLVSPVFGDQECVARVVDPLGVGVRVESMMYPSHEGAPISRVAEAILPEMLAPGLSRWKAAVADLTAKLVADGDALQAAENAILG